MNINKPPKTVSGGKEEGKEHIPGLDINSNAYDKKVNTYVATESGLISQRDDLVHKLTFEPEKLGKMKVVYERLLDQTKADLEAFYERNKTKPSKPATPPMQ